jgi:hypothetical protein
LASFLTLSITGSAPVPVPMMSRLHFPGDGFLGRHRRVAVGLSEFLGELLLPLANLPTIDQHVVFVGNAIDTDAAEREIFETARGRRRRATSFHGIGPFIAVIT